MRRRSLEARRERAEELRGAAEGAPAEMPGTFSARFVN